LCFFILQMNGGMMGFTCLLSLENIESTYCHVFNHLHVLIVNFFLSLMWFARNIEFCNLSLYFIFFFWIYHYCDEHCLQNHLSILVNNFYFYTPKPIFDTSKRLLMFCELVKTELYCDHFFFAH